MNLILVHLVDFPIGGAGSQHARLMVKGLRENGENAGLVIPHPLAIGSNSHNPRPKGHDRGVPFLHLSGAADRSGNPVWRFFQNYRGVLKTTRFIRRRHKRHKLEAVILGTPDLLKFFPIVFTCIFSKIPLFIWAVEKMTLEEGTGGLHGVFKRLGHGLSERILPRFAAGYIVISSHLKKHYRRYLQEPQVMVSPILIDPNEEPAACGNPSQWREKFPGKSLVVYSGTFAEKDGVTFMLEAFARVLSSGLKTCFILTGAGDPKHMDQARRDIKRLNLGSHCHMTGFLSTGSLRALHQSARLLLACRSRSPFAQHGFPWKLGEYCMTGIPVLATDVGDIKTYFKNGEDLFLAEPNDPRSIATAIISILSNPDLALRVGRAGRGAARSHFHYIPRCKEIASFIHNNLPPSASSAT